MVVSASGERDARPGHAGSTSIGTCNPSRHVRVPSEELVSTRERVASQGRPYSGENLDGAIMDVDHALFDGGFGRCEIKRTGDLPPMVLFACCSSGDDAEPEEVVRRLQHAWITHGAFANEAHSITIDGSSVVLDFVTWWDADGFYTGRIEVTLG